MEIRFDRALIVATLTALLSGCPLDGDNGEAGTTGLAGINCWDTNQNRINDPDEDRNFDGVWDVKDCSTTQQTTQSLDVALNHQHFCEAFATLGRIP